MKLIGLVFSCLFLFSLATWADDTATFNGMLALANKGDAEAQYHVGMMYNNGIGTPQNPSQAFVWFEKSAASNDPLGAYKLGCYYSGQFAGVVEVNADKALKFKLIAAEAGYSLAQHDVAVIYSRQGNLDQAMKWLKLAAAQGYDVSLWALSGSYYEGKGVPQDLILAFAYFALSQQMSEVGMTDKGNAILEEIGARLSASEKEKAQKFIAEWKPQPSALSIKAKNGITEAEKHLQKSK